MWKKSKSINKSTKQTDNGKVRGHLLSKGYTYMTEGCLLEHKTCDILAAERLRLMRFDNRLIIDSFQEAICILNGNFGCVFYLIQHCTMQ